MAIDDEATDRVRASSEEATQVRFIAVETYMREMKRWLAQKFTEMEDRRKNDAETMNEIRERIVRVETRMELRDGALTPGPMPIVKQPLTNPLNRSVGSFMGDILMSAIKMVSVGVITALAVLGFQKSQEKGNTTINNVQAPQPAPAPAPMKAPTP